MITTLTRTWLAAVRLPLTAAERLTHADDTWAPTLAYDAVEAQAKQLLGSVLRDDALVRESRLQRARLAELRRAATLEADAERLRAQADERLEVRTETAEAQRERVEREAREQEERLAREQAAEQRRVAEQAAQRAEAARRTERQRQAAVEAKQRDARATEVAAESAALAGRRRAVAAAGTAVAVDGALERRKAARKAK
jgi:hypothetical protein